MAHKRKPDGAVIGEKKEGDCNKWLANLTTFDDKQEALYLKAYCNRKEGHEGGCSFIGDKGRYKIIKSNKGRWDR